MSGALDRELRGELGKAIAEARQVAEEGARGALESLAVERAEPDASMSAEAKELRRRLRAHARALGDRRPGAGKHEITRLAHEVAYEHWHRMLFARFLAENGLLIHPEYEVEMSLDDCRDLALEEGKDPWELASRWAERMLPQVFRPDDPSLAVTLFPETRQTLEKLLAGLPRAVFLADDSIGWAYQFWQSERKDQVNRSGVKIGADELPVVTQLFTERYMVRFLFHNTVGAWRAGKALAARPELATGAEDEDTLRAAVRLDGAGGYEFEYLRFVREPSDEGGEESDRDTGEPNAGDAGRWRPAAGAYSKWPRAASDLKFLDPCCGSGHFLVEGFQLFVRLRMEEEGLALDDAIHAVLRDNLHGLELDRRCVQLAAFSVALAAWKLAGGVIELPRLKIACSGLAPNASKEDWLAVAAGAPDSAGSPGRGPAPRRDEPDAYGPPDPGSVHREQRSVASFTRCRSGERRSIEATLAALYDLFRDAPTLGSLLDAHTTSTRLGTLPFASIEPVLKQVLEQAEPEPELREHAVAAAGMAQAATILAGRYSLVITNPPYLARGKQGARLRNFAAKQHPKAKGELATMFVERALRWQGESGTQAFVLPQNWLFLKTYQKLREDLLHSRRWRFVSRLGPGAFETIGGHVVSVALVVLSAEKPAAGTQFAGLDASAPRGQTPIPAPEKAELLRTSPAILASHAFFESAPDMRIAFFSSSARSWLYDAAIYSRGICTGDDLCFCRSFWETGRVESETWSWQHTTSSQSQHYGGQRRVLRWDDGGGALLERVEARLGDNVAQWIRGRRVWRKAGIAVSPTGQIRCCIYAGDYFDANTLVVVPRRRSGLPALWAYCSSSEYAHDVRQADSALKVGDSVVKVPFEIKRWKQVAAEKYPNGLPEPYSDDPTQWLFHGHPFGSVVWDEEAKRLAHGPLRTDSAVLQVAVARLLGYRWPAEQDPDMRLSAESREWVEESSELDRFADADGIVPLPSVRGEAPAASRLRDILAAAYETGGAPEGSPKWSTGLEQRLLRAAAGKKKPAPSLDAWLRDRFFEEHCKLFRHRPFVWQVWDGLKGGFSALVNAHRLAGPDGEGRRTLESLTWSYLGDWITRQRAAVEKGAPGAEARLEAAMELQAKLEAILLGEPPLDLFVRWKPLHEQAIGWEPDLDDGVRLNIRPFMKASLRRGRKGAGVLRWKPTGIKWGKDRGKEPLHLKPKRKGDEPELYRPIADFPWFWSCPGDPKRPVGARTDFTGGLRFDGNRWNDLHYTRRAKQEARERAARRARTTG